MFERESALNILSEEQVETIHEQAMRILEEIGTDVLHDGARKVLAEAGQVVDGDRVYWDRGFVMEQVAKAPSSFRLRARNPERSVTVGEGGTPVWMNVGGPPFASDLDEGRRIRADPGSRHAREAHPSHGRPELRPDGRGGGHRPPDGVAPHGPGVLDDPLVGQAVHHLRDQRPARPRWHPDGRDRARQPHGHRGGGGLARHREPELAVDLGLPHDRRADRMGRGEPADRRHPVPPGGRHVGGERVGWADAAGGGGPLRRGPRPDGARGRALPLRLVLHGHRHAHRLAGVRHARVGLRGARGWAARAPVRTPLPRRGRTRVLARGGRAGCRRDADDALGDDARRHRRGAARGRMARRWPHGQLREVRARRRAAAAVQAADGRRSGSRRRSSRSTR